MIKKIITQLKPETAHALALFAAKLLQKSSSVMELLRAKCFAEDDGLSVNMGNLHFPNHIGIAAGYDKNGEIIPFLEALGFGFVEVGTTTPLPQDGNDKPRLFRLPEDRALINRMGFNNKGMNRVYENVNKYWVRNNPPNRQSTPKIPIGINIGKNRTTLVESAVRDYTQGIRQFWNVANYFVINISSPNTQGLCEFHKSQILRPFLREITEVRNKLSENPISGYRQLWLKLSPDINDDTLKGVVDISLEFGIDALVVSNTSILRKGLISGNKLEKGGLSGMPLFDRSNEMLARVAELSERKIHLVGVGGVMSAKDAMLKMELGAKLVQIYTGLTYEGFLFVKRLKEELHG